MSKDAGRYAVVGLDGIVANIVLWDGHTEWSPPDDTTLVPLSPTNPASKGDTYDGKTFTPEPEPEPTPEVAQ